MKISSNILMLPEVSVDIFEMLVKSGKTSEEAEKTILNTGVNSIRKANVLGLTSFIMNGIDSIMHNHPEFFDDVDAVIVVSQSYDQRIPSISTRVQDKLNITSKAFCLDVMDGCSGYIKALHLADGLLAGGRKKVLVLAGDLNSKMTSGSEIGTQILFGDGVSVTTLEPNYQESEILLFNEGDNTGVISCTMSGASMETNGFEVFRFTNNKIPKLIKDFLEDKNLSIENFDYVGLHQASNLVVANVFKKLRHTNKLCGDFLCGEIGNIGAGSIGAWLSQIDFPIESRDSQLLASGFGSGLSWGLATVGLNLKHNGVLNVRS